MKASLVIFGVIFLVIGGLMYLVPTQGVKADTTTVGNGATDSRTSSASVTVPVGWAYTSGIIGFVLFIMGLAASCSVKTVQGPRGPRGRVVPVYVRRAPRRSNKSTLPRGTSVTTTTRIRR